MGILCAHGQVQNSTVISEKWPLDLAAQSSFLVLPERSDRKHEELGDINQGKDVCRRGQRGREGKHLESSNSLEHGLEGAVGLDEFPTFQHGQSTSWEVRGGGNCDCGGNHARVRGCFCVGGTEVAVIVAGLQREDGKKGEGHCGARQTQGHY